jgi:hypothetical protein
MEVTGEFDVMYVVIFQNVYVLRCYDNAFCPPQQCALLAVPTLLHLCLFVFFLVLDVI